MICAVPSCEDEAVTIWKAFCLCGSHLEMAYEVGEGYDGDDLMDLMMLAEDEWDAERSESAVVPRHFTTTTRRVRAAWADAVRSGVPREDREEAVRQQLSDRRQRRETVG